MALFRVSDNERTWILQTPSLAVARNNVTIWNNQFKKDLAPNGSQWKLADVSAAPTSLSNVRSGDTYFTGRQGYEITKSNLAQFRTNITSGQRYDYLPVVDSNIGGAIGTDETIPELGDWDYVLKPGDPGYVAPISQGPAIPPGPPEDSADIVDPVAGFLKGLGFDFNQSAGRARDFQQGQGALGAGTYAAQQAADLFADDIPGGGPQTKEQFGGDLRLQNPGNAFGGIGRRALQNTGFLSGLGVDNVGNDQTDLFNPFSAPSSSQRQDLASLLTAAFQGAGVSSLYNKGVSSSDIARMFTTFAGQNPGIGNAGEGLDQNFLSYAADNLGLSRFFNQ
jgi:hypothetical protein